MSGGAQDRAGSGDAGPGTGWSPATAGIQRRPLPAWLPLTAILVGTTLMVAIGLSIRSVQTRIWTDAVPASQASSVIVMLLFERQSLLRFMPGPRLTTLDGYIRDQVARYRDMPTSGTDGRMAEVPAALVERFLASKDPEDGRAAIAAWEQLQRWNLASAERLGVTVRDRTDLLLAIIVLTSLAFGVLAAAAWRRFIADRTTHLHRLAERKTRLQQILDASLDAVITVDSGGRVVQASRAVETMFGWPVGDLVGQPLSVLIPEQSRAAHPGHLAGYLATGGDRRMSPHRRVQGRHRDGRLFHIETALSRVVIDGETYATAVVRDISEQIALESELRSARDVAAAEARQRRDLLAVASHEIRTPLNGLIGGLILLDRGAHPDEERRRLALARQAAAGLLETVNRLLDFSRLDAGAMGLEPAPCDLVRLLRQVRDGFSEAAAAKGLTLAVATSDDLPPWVLADGLRLRQILGNLVNNAVKFTAAGGVTVRVARSTGDDLVFTVSDTGIGIPADRLAAIFQPYQQGGPDTSRRYGGTGLGLAISDGLVRAMGGCITVDSVPGQGSSFTAVVPLPGCPPASDRISAAPATPALPLALRGRILVAEDTVLNQELMRSMLGDLGLTVDVVGDGPAAVAAAAAIRYDLLILDIHLPGCDGDEALRRIRAAQASPPPAVALSASCAADEAPPGGRRVSSRCCPNRSRRTPCTPCCSGTSAGSIPSRRHPGPSPTAGCPRA
jgi:PAS domain S-box-containing protein